MASSSSPAGDGMRDTVTADAVCVNNGNQQEGEKQVLSDDDRVK
jgi:hypothetical protein